MIHGVYANQSSFHSVEFTTGLNVVLAERTDTSTQRDTRNGLGKSMLIEIIDFCLGGAGKALGIEPLRKWAFTLEITLGGNRIKVTRAVESKNRIVIEGPTTGWIEQPYVDDETAERILNVERWKTVLGWALFGLPGSDLTHKYKPKYRSLISYFMRQGPNAYTDPFSHFRQQKTWDIQLHVAFLLGLNWEYASRWQELKDQEQALAAFSQAIETGALQERWGSVGELEAERVQLEEQVGAESEALSSFKVHPQYKSVQEEADRTTATIHGLANDNVTDRRRLARYRESIAEEKPPADTALERLYEEAGLIFPEAVRRTLAEAKEFHYRIVENRRAFLETEISRLERNIGQRDEGIREITAARAASLEILRTHGALQEMTKLQERHAETKGRLERVRARISEIKDLTSRKRDIRVAKTELVRVAEQDHEQRRDIWAAAVRLFNDNSQALYKTPGRLVIDIAETGYKYDVDIERSGSEGIGKMKVFCFDLTLLQFMMRQKDRIDFLVHDSVLYDGVDSRQRALALERASQSSRALGAQYICALNSDMIPREDFSEGFDFDQHVRLTLTDKDPSGRLLGFQFERPTR
jgi:uncharacterized protein YydD (DUF2326 family)